MAPRRVLIIDDEEDIREIASIALETGGDYDVLAAEGGESGISTAAAHVPDAILLDVMMPGIDGPSVYLRLQESQATRNIPVIFMTAKVQAADRRSLTNLGARGIIAKPFDPMLLAQQVAEILSW